MSNPTSVSLYQDTNHSKHGYGSPFDRDACDQKAHISATTESLTDELYTINNTNDTQNIHHQRSNEEQERTLSQQTSTKSSFPTNNSRNKPAIIRGVRSKKNVLNSKTNKKWRKRNNRLPKIKRAKGEEIRKLFLDRNEELKNYTLKGLKIHIGKNAVEEWCGWFDVIQDERHMQLHIQTLICLQLTQYGSAIKFRSEDKTYVIINLELFKNGKIIYGVIQLNCREELKKHKLINLLTKYEIYDRFSISREYLPDTIRDKSEFMEALGVFEYHRTKYSLTGKKEKYGSTPWKQCFSVDAKVEREAMKERVDEWQNKMIYTQKPIKKTYLLPILFTDEQGVYDQIEWIHFFNIPRFGYDVGVVLRLTAEKHFVLKRVYMDLEEIKVRHQLLGQSIISIFQKKMGTNYAKIFDKKVARSYLLEQNKKKFTFISRSQNDNQYPPREKQKYQSLETGRFDTELGFNQIQEWQQIYSIDDEYTRLWNIRLRQMYQSYRMEKAVSDIDMQMQVDYLLMDQSQKPYIPQDSDNCECEKNSY